MEPEKQDGTAAEESAATGEPMKKKKEKKHSFRDFFNDFKAFISKGNIINLAVAVVIGAAFGAIVTALVNDFIMPLISLVAGKDGLSALKWELIAADPATGSPGVYLLWGDFLQKVIDFIIIAFFIFLILRLLMNAQKGIGKAQKQWQKKLKKNPELAANPPEDLKAADPAAEPAKIESSEDILKDIRTLLAKLAEKENKGPEAPKE